MDYFSREAMMLYGIIATLFVATLNLKNSKGDRYIDSINAERVKWINTIRELFSKYNKVAFIMGENLAQYNTNESEYTEELIYLNNHIELFLNPTEVISKKVIELQDVISGDVTYNQVSYNYQQHQDNLYNLHYLQQVILKSEWKRIKKETKSGKEMEKKDLRDIYIEIAIAIDKDKYELLLKDPFEEEGTQ